MIPPDLLFMGFMGAIGILDVQLDRYSGRGLIARADDFMKQALGVMRRKIQGHLLKSLKAISARRKNLLGSLRAMGASRNVGGKQKENWDEIF